MGEPKTSSMEELTRRRFLTRVTAGAAAAIGGLLGAPIIGYLLGPLLRPQPDDWQPVYLVDQQAGGQGAMTVGGTQLGPSVRADQLAVGETALVAFREPSPLPWAGQTALTSAYLRREGPEQFLAFAVNCTHLGCPVNWQPGSQLFLCPCHGGVYYADGTVAAGPPPRQLFQYRTRVRDGGVELLTHPLELV